MPSQSLWMLFAAFLFAVMGVCVKLASNEYSTSEIVMYRSLIGAVLIAGWVALKGGSLRTALPWHHAWRGIVGTTSLWLWFYAIGMLPLATAMTLNYMSPIWIAAIVFGTGWWRGQKRFEWGLASAIAISFIGVILLLRPVMDGSQWLGALMGLISSVLTALAYMQVRYLGQLGEPEYRTVFYFCIAGILAGLIGMLVDGQLFNTFADIQAAHSPKGLALLFGVGIFATIAQIAMSRAYRLGRVLVTANLQYTGIVFASFWGILLWNDLLPAISWIGMAIILLSGVAATYYNTRSSAVVITKPNTPGTAPCKT